MSYVVLARKWRPQTFADLTGQEHVARTLANAIARERVPHALLFTGARGVGKTSSARILAMALNCAEGPTATPCGVCPACTEIQQGRATDVLEIDGASNRGINEIRELRDGVRYAPQRDRHKIYIIDEVHMLTMEAFNALLKTLEEPPAHVVFVFATTEAQKIPVTILSRCQRFDFRRISHRDIVGRLRHIVEAEGIAVPDDVLALVARQAAGGMRDALSLLDQIIAFSGDRIDLDGVSEILGAADRRRLFELSRAVLDRDPAAALDVLDQVLGHGLDAMHFTAEWVSHLRDLNVVRAAQDARHLTTLTDSELTEALEQVQRVHSSVLQRAFELMVAEAEVIARAAWPRIVLEMAVLRLCEIESVHSIGEVVARLEAMARGERLPPPSAEVAQLVASVARPRRRTPTERVSRPDAPVPSTPAAQGPAPSPADADAPVAEAAQDAAPSRGSAASERPPGDAGADAPEAPGLDALPPSGSSGSESRLEAERVESASSAADAADAASPRPADGERETPPPGEPEATAADSPADVPAEAGAAEGEAAPASGPVRAAEAAAEPGTASSSAAADAAGGRRVALQDWRQVVEAWDGERPHIGRLLARSWLVDEGGEELLLGVPEELETEVGAEVLSALTADLGAATGRPGLTLRRVTAGSLSPDVLEKALQLRSVEQVEREAFRAEALAAMQEHRIVKEIEARWPGTAVQVHIDEGDA